RPARPSVARLLIYSLRADRPARPRNRPGLRETMTKMGEIKTLDDLEEALSRPSEQDVAAVRRIEGDILILGAGGKMGPSLAQLCRRAADAAGTPRRIIAVSRRQIEVPGVESIACDLLDRTSVADLPDCPNILYLAGRKFGSTGSPELTWAMNTVL